MADTRVINGVVVGGKTDHITYRNCPHCLEDLTSLGVEGVLTVDLKANVAATDLSLTNQVKVSQTTTQGTVITCPKCKKRLEMTGVFAQLWAYHEINKRAIATINTLAQAGYIPPAMVNDVQKLLTGDVYDTRSQYVAMDMNGNVVSTHDTYNQAFDAVNQQNLADVQMRTVPLELLPPQSQDKGPKTKDGKVRMPTASELAAGFAIDDDEDDDY